MSESTNTSFIPKRNPVKNKKRNTAHSVFIGTLLVRIFFFAVMIATLGIFTYEKSLNKDLNAEVVRFNEAIESFDQKKMQQIIDIDARINLIEDRLKHTASITAIFEAIELAVIEPVQIRSLELVRLTDTEFTIDANLKTDSFGSVIFQRSIFNDDDKLVVSNIENVKLINATRDPSESVGLEGTLSTVEFSASLTIPTEKIPHSITPFNPIGVSQIIDIEQDTDNTDNTDNTDLNLLEFNEQSSNQIDI
jgi:hypothetical protein